jgi:3-methyladenine DNA glycosylase AlkD
MNSRQIQSLIRKKSSPKKAAILQRFFKTAKGQYGEGDIFVGVTVPEVRKIAKFAQETSLLELKKLLQSKTHEDRLVALEILVFQFEKAIKNCDQKNQKEIFDFYLKNRSGINNWDLVDLSAPYIVGPYLFNCINTKKTTSINILYKLAKSKNLWDKRISIISTFDFIRNNKFSDTLKISKILLNDEHDLIQKAVGWMLREIGKREEKVLKVFLKENYRKMPRTMLRYAIEKFPLEIRKKYLYGEIC